MKKRLDKLTLYNRADEYYRREFKMKIYKENIGMLDLFSWLNWYQWISNFNTSPTKAVYWLIFVIVSFWSIYAPSSLTCLESLQLSFISSIPLIGVPEGIEPKGWILIPHYIQVVFSTIVWSLLVLSIHRKFKR